MPPIIALFICSSFVLWLLYLDHKQSPETSRTLWIPTVWMLVIASKPLAIWFGTGGTDMDSGSPLDRLFFIIIACIAIIVVAARRADLPKWFRRNKWLLILLVYMLISIFWSARPYVSFKRWSRELISVLMVLYIATENYPRNALQCVLRRIIYILIPFSIILIKYYPDLGVVYSSWSGMQMWAGATFHKNSLSGLCGLSIIFLCWSFIGRKQGYENTNSIWLIYAEIFLLILSVWLFLGPSHSFNNSATATICLASGLTILIRLSIKSRLGKSIGLFFAISIILATIMYGTITPFIGKLSIIDVSSTFNREESLTGRSTIWETLIPYAISKPLFGHGFGGFWTDLMRDLSASHAHNGYLDIILNLGFLGLILFTIIFLINCKYAQLEMCVHSQWGILWFCILVMSIMQNITESTMTSLASFNAVILMLFQNTTDALTAPRENKTI